MVIINRNTIPLHNKLIILFVFTFLSLLFVKNVRAEQCNGQFFNFVTETNWRGVFPIKLGGVTLDPFGMMDTDTVAVSNPLCFCGNPPMPGIKVSFWEPIRVIEIVRKPGCYPSLGGIDMGVGKELMHGMNKKSDGGAGSKSHGKAFYQTHFIAFPVLAVLNLLSQNSCTTNVAVDVLYMTEVDPMWGNDELNAVINPEAVLFGNPITQAVCAADSISASAGWPIDALFWCCGSWGSVYPFNGSITHNTTPLQTAALSVCRFMAKMHREMFSTSAWLTTGESALCSPQPLPLIKKSQYRIQLIYPVPTTEAEGVFPLGRGEVMWGIGKWFPMSGEDFAFLMWRKKDCCMQHY